MANLGGADPAKADDPGSPGGPGSSLDPTSLPGGAITPCVALPLKTPRAPKLLWSCERQVFLEKLRVANTAHWQQLVSMAARTATPAASYGDNGDFAALLYQATGDVSYAQKASAQLRQRLRENAQPTQNYTRELQGDFAIIYDWIKGGIPQGERDEIETALYSWVDQILANGPAGQPVRLDDTDQTTGNYFGSMMLAVSTLGENPRAQQLLDNPVFGGLDATGADLTNMRNAVKKYVSDWAAGGVWVESSYYDIETLQLLGQGVEALRTATGVDHFPELAGFADQVVRAQMAQLAPDLAAAAKWGDLESAGDLEAWRRYQTLGMFTGLLPANSSLRPYATQFTNDLKAAHPTDPVYRARFWYYFDPLAATADWRSALPRTYFARGQGALFSHDGWQASDTMFFAHLRRAPMGIDHEHTQVGDFGVYRKGRWVLTHPLGYGGGAAEPLAINSMVIGGLDAMIDRKLVGESHAADGSYVYLAGSASGERYTQPYYLPPPAFVSEWTRSLVYLPTLNKSADTVVVYDRVSALPPTVLDRYRGDDAARMAAAPALKQWILHTLEQPSVSAGGATWSVGTQKAELTALAPAARTTLIVDEKGIASWPANFPPASERHYYLSMAPATNQPWDTFLNVLQFSDVAVASKPTRVASTDGSIEGTRLSRPGQPDAIVLFSAAQASRVRSTGYSVALTLADGGAELYLADLDPGKTWTVDGVALSVDASGFGHLSLSGSGARTVVVVAS